MAEQQLYYLLDARTPVGNCALWWRPDGKGYTCNLSDAGLYAETDAYAHRDTDIPIPQAVAEQAVNLHVDYDAMRTWAKRHLPAGSDKIWDGK